MGGGVGDVLHERERESAPADAIDGAADGGSLVVVEGPSGGRRAQRPSAILTNAS